MRAAGWELPNAAGWALLALGLIAFVAWSAMHLGFFAWSIDEGMYLQRARMWSAGFALYEDIWFNHPPGMVLLLRAVFERYGESVETGRMVAVAFGCVGLAAVVLIGRELAGWTAGLLAGVALVLSPLFLGLSRAIMTTLPALCMATFALWLALRYRATRRKTWLLASGVAFGLGLTVKFIGAPMIVPIGLAIVWPKGAGRGGPGARVGRGEQGAGADADGNAGPGPGAADLDLGNDDLDTRGYDSAPGEPERRASEREATAATVWRSMLQPAALGAFVGWGIVGGAVLLAVLSLFGLRALLPQTVGSVVGARDAFALDAVANIQDVLEWLSEGHLGLAALGVYGLARGVWRDDRWWLVVAWLAAAGVAVLAQTPLWSHHLVFFALPLAVGAGAGARWAVGDAVGAARRLSRRGAQATIGARDEGGVEPGWLSFGLVAILVFLFALPVALRRDAETTERGSEDPWTAVAMLREMQEPYDYVVTDSPMIAFRAGLRVPPNLTDPGAKRFASGDLTLSEVTRDALLYESVALVTWNERLAKDSRQRLPQWLDDNEWTVVATLDEGRERRIWTPPERPPAVVGGFDRPVGWADGVSLVGVDVGGSPTNAGETMQVTLYWRARDPAPLEAGWARVDAVSGNYTVFVHLLDPQGERRAQHDNPPGRGVRATNTWLGDERIIDRYELDVPTDAPAGDYTLRIGLYDAETGDALALEDAGGQVVDGDTLVVGPVAVGSR